MKYEDGHAPTRSTRLTLPTSASLTALAGFHARSIRRSSLHYKTPSLGPSLGPAFGLGGVPWWCLGGISLGPRLHQGSARLGGALVDGNPPRLSVFVVTFGNTNVTFQNYLNLEGC